MIIVVTGMFDRTDSGEYIGKQFGVSHGIDYYTGAYVPLPSVSPEVLGAIFDDNLDEWVLYD